jgi:hypothetical protein
VGPMAATASSSIARLACGSLGKCCPTAPSFKDATASAIGDVRVLKAPVDRSTKENEL